MPPDIVLDPTHKDHLLMLKGMKIEPVEVLDFIFRIQDFEVSQTSDFQEEIVVLRVDVDSDTLVPLGVSETL